MPPMFTRFVEPGRLTLITYGPCEGKLCTIIDIVDQGRVIVDGPYDITGVKRHMMPIKRLMLTDLRCKLDFGAREKALRKALEREDIMNKWSQTNYAKKLKAKEARRTMTDFERFKLMVVKRRVRKQITKALKKK
mmetsp:Transcript_76692/g.248265  ORF Transcript_76692/g.248265 Transcript_76692/m.248265 type:complete len:135 (+) Transcript_76692:78-482(+)